VIIDEQLIDSLKQLNENLVMKIEEYLGVFIVFSFPFWKENILL